MYLNVGYAKLMRLSYCNLPHEEVKILDYPNGEIAIQYGYRKLNFKTFDKLQKIDQGRVVDNKRLVQVLRFAQQKQEEFELKKQSERSTSCPKRTAQKRALNQSKTINPTLINKRN
jgi:hypothetical protein